MATMNSKIRKPFLILIVVFPLVMLFLFNLAFSIYIERNTRSELKLVAATVKTTIKRELPVNLQDFTQNNLERAFVKISKAITTTSKIAANVDIILFNKNFQLIYPLDTEKHDLGGLAERISERLPLMEKNEIYAVRQGAERYLVLSYPLTRYQAPRPTIVFLAQAEGAASLLHTVNTIMLMIMLAGIILAALIANHLSKRIAQPVSELCDITKEIGNGKLFLPEQSKRAHDIEELNLLYKSINEMVRRLEASDKMQKTFFQNASHELRTPLMSIQGYAEGIAKGVLPDTPGAAEIIESESRRLNTLVEELLTLSKIENQSFERELAAINLNDILKEYIQRLGGLPAGSAPKLELDLPEYDVTVLADDNLLSRAVINISSNCLRYAETLVNITLLRSGEDAVIRISDDGSGIKETVLPHIFERFYKGDGGNFGLGLAIARSAIEAMNGSIRAYNGDKGAVFEITLPLLKKDESD